MSMNITGVLMLVYLYTFTSVSGHHALPHLRRNVIPSGETWVTGWADVAGFEYDSNDTYPVAHFVYLMLHHLADPNDSGAYCSGVMLSDQAAIFDLEKTGESGLLRRIMKPILSAPVRRVGNVIEYEMTVPIVLKAVS